MKSKPRGFTLIEVLITLSLMGAVFLPMMHLFSASMVQSDYIEEITAARFLAQEEMEKIKNLGFTEAQLAARGSFWEPALNVPPLEQNGKKWRVFNDIKKDADPLEIHVKVYRVAGREVPDLSKPVAQVATLIEDLEWV